MFALRFSILLLLLTAMFAAPVRAQQGLWNVESSTVQESGSNAEIRFMFRTATGYFASQGAGAGSALFEGERSGDQVSGLAWAYKVGCPAESYEASGNYAPDGKTLTLTGREPIKDAFCKVVSYRDRTLVLTQQLAVATPAPQSTPPPPPPPPSPAPPAVAFPPAAPASPSRSFWDHNGSTLYLVANGKSRELYYDAPHPRMAGVGVRNGTLLFQGVYAAGSYSGTAHIFTRQCGVLPYQVSGPVTNNFEKITLHGQKPVPDANCNIRYAPDTLEFDLCVKTLPPGAVARLCPQ